MAACRVDVLSPCLWCTVDATQARDRMNPVSLKVTKFSNKSSRDFQEIPSFSVVSFCDHDCSARQHGPIRLQWQICVPCDRFSAK